MTCDILILPRGQLVKLGMQFFFLTQIWQYAADVIALGRFQPTKRRPFDEIDSIRVGPFQQTGPTAVACDTDSQGTAQLLSRPRTASCASSPASA